jgi:hypothetical protein
MTSTCHTPCMRVELEQRISTFLASHHEETLGKADRNAARRIDASTIWQLSGPGDETRTTNSSE